MDKEGDSRELDEPPKSTSGPGVSPKLSLLIIGGIAIAGIVLMCLTVLLLVLLGDN